jgi:hypothetical protein
MSLFLFMLAPVFAGPVDQLTLYKNPGGMILYVTFEYDVNGKNISRTIYDWGGFVIRRTAVFEDAGRTVQQNYHEGNGELRSYALYAYAGEQKTVSIFSEFSQLLFQASYNTASANNNYTLSTGERMAYEYNGDGTISLIKIFDKDNNWTHYARVHYQGQSATGKPQTSGRNGVSSIRKLSASAVEFVFSLEKDRRVRADVYDVRGCLVSSVLDRIYQKGEHRLVLDVGKNRKLAQEGVYILKFTLGDDQNTFKLKIVK